MLYTVSAVQILITIDAVDELEKRGRGGKEKVGSCTYSLTFTNINNCLLNHQSLQNYRMQTAPSWETSGAKQIPGSYMVP